MKILKQFFSVLFVLLCVVGTGYAATFDGVRELVSRRAPWLGKHIQFKEIASSDGDCFILQTVGKKLVVQATGANTAAVGVNWYLKYYCHRSMSHLGDQLAPVTELPVIGQPVTVKTTSIYRYALNYCTFNYTMSFYDWDDWQWELDWMALNGVNLMLVANGSEAVWQNTLRRMNYSEKEIADFITGPAYNAWWLMGNIEGWGGPMPQSQIDSRKKLVQKMLKRMKSLGIEPLMPGFYGMVPSNLKNKSKAHIIPQGTWGAFTRPDILDPALLRPGRFDRQIYVGLPDIKGREEILKVHAKKIKVAEDVDFNKVARMASGASGAELANIVNEAALRAVRDGRRYATQSDLEESIEVVIAGYQKKNAILTDKEKRVVAYHEVGHALVAAKQTNSAPVQKITIVPRTSGALGYTMQVEEGNHYLISREELENKIATLTGGRAAEELIFNSESTGAANDIEQATKLARAMITRYGMSDDFDMVALETVNNQYLGGDTSLACSAETQTQIDKQVVSLVKSQHEKALGILKENRAKLDEIAAYLYDKETITGEEFMRILNA